MALKDVRLIGEPTRTRPQSSKPQVILNKITSPCKPVMTSNKDRYANIENDVDQYLQI